MARSITHTRLLGTLGVVALGLTAAGCGSSSDAQGSDTKTVKTVAYSSPVESQPSQQNQVRGIEAAAAALGWKQKVLDANLSADTQVSNVQTLIDQKVDAISAWVLDPGAIEGAFAKAKAAGIPIVAINTDVPGAANTVWWQMNLCKSEDAPVKQVAARIAKARPGGKVIVMGGPPAPSILANVACFTNAAKADGLKVVNETDNMNDTAASASALVADVLAKYPDVDAIWAYNDATALGASSALDQAGLHVSDGTSDGVLVIGSNGDPDAIQAIKDGRLTGSIDPNGVAFGYATVKAMADAIAGKTGRTYIVDSVYYDASNIDKYVAPDKQKFDIDHLPMTVQ